jgi:pimeloyl-ACP methyl ester carboxylesterase
MSPDRRGRRFRGAVATLAATFLGLFAWWSTRSSTPLFRTADGRVLPGSVASLERIRLGGIDQWILVRGRDRANPILVFLHGGPGMPAMYLAHAFQGELENSFTVVHWDRRGAGKSYSKDVPRSSLAVSQQLADTLDLVDVLRTRFGQRRVHLVAHSWGSLLGILAVSRRPDLFSSYVGVGQVVDDARARRIQVEFVEKEARARNEEKVIEEIRRSPDSLEKYLFRYGGELKKETSWWPLLAIGLRAPEYSFWDAVRVPRGVSFSHANTRDDVLGGRAPGEAIRRLEVPVWFFAGRSDYTSPSALVSEYVHRVEAPRKELVWFENSSHFPFLEEPARFAAEMRRVRAATKGPS